MTTRNACTKEPIAGLLVNDLINFPTGLDSAGLPAGDFVPESPWPTGVQRRLARDDRNLDVTNNLWDVGCAACDSRARRYNESNDDFTFSRFILLAGNTQSSVTLASSAPLRSAAVNVSLLRFLSVNNYLLS